MTTSVTTRDLSVLACLQQWDYCDPKRGQSSDDRFFVRNMRTLVREFSTYWYDQYIKDLDRLNAGLIDAVRAQRPDMVFFAPFLHHVRPDALAEVRKLATTVAWFSDDQWRFDSYSRDYSAHFDLVVTTDPWSVGPYRALGREVLLSQWAADRTDAVPITDDRDFRHDVTFVGMKTPYRAWFVKRLARLGVSVECFGHGWPTGRVSYEEMHEVFRTSRISLNLSNSVSLDIRAIFHSPKSLAMTLLWKKRTEQIKARNFEIPGAGGFEMSYFVSGLEQYYDLAREIALFDGPEDCARQVRHYLESPDLRIAMTRAALDRTIREHTWDVRLGGVLDAAAALRGKGDSEGGLRSDL